MESLKNAELLSDQEVMQEIERYKWVESEKAGKDIGFEKAAHDWLADLSSAWIKVNRRPAKSFLHAGKGNGRKKT